MPGNLLFASRVATDFCLQKLLLGKAGSPGSGPDRHKQDSNSASLGLAAVHFGTSK